MALANMMGRQRPPSYKYSALPDAVGREGTQPDSNAWTGRNKRILKVSVCASIVGVALFFLGGYMKTTAVDYCDKPLDGFQCRPDISHFWGQYSPYYSVPSEIDRATPEGCSVTFAQVLSRHGARDPTLSKTIMYGALLARIQQSVSSYGRHHEFLGKYNYTMGADQLSLFGEREMINSGINFYKRYEHLTSTQTPFVRSAGQNRVVVSARNWTQGYHLARLADERTDEPDDYPYDILVIPEASGFNNSLSPDGCPAFRQGPSSNTGHDAQNTWLRVFAPLITERLNKNLPGANLTDLETIDLMDMCPFDTVADADGKISPFCNIFATDEWHAYDYYQSLGKWYGYSNGNPLGPTQGVGFVNELIARLTQKPVVDHTTTNTTLDQSNDTFPLSEKLYADFSHDNDMSGVFAALGLYNATAPLSNTTKASPKYTNGYSASWAVPFASRMYVEKMECSGVEEELVRVLVNDRVIPLQGCDADEAGRCRLGRFVDSLSFAKGGGHWPSCFA